MKFERIFLLVLISLISFSCATYTSKDEGGIVGTGNEEDCIEGKNEPEKCKEK